MLTAVPMLQSWSNDVIYVPPMKKGPKTRSKGKLLQYITRSSLFSLSETNILWCQYSTPRNGSKWHSFQFKKLPRYQTPYYRSGKEFWIGDLKGSNTSTCHKKTETRPLHSQSNWKVETKSIGYNATHFLFKTIYETTKS